MTKFTSFVVLADMRTGSNFLEANLNALDGVSCLGELFNPFFIAYPNREEVLGMTLDARDTDPFGMLSRVRAQPGLAGFRLFHDHDARAYDAVMDDPDCAKIVLTRNPAESYVSLKIARATGQWKLTNTKKARREVVRFERTEFLSHVQALQGFQIDILNRLQRSGQTAFYIAYEDLQDVSVLNGLAQWLGVAGRLKSLDGSLKRQNPQALADKVSNADDMRTAMSELDLFDVTRTPNFEPRRGAVAPSYVAAAGSGLLYQPIRSGPETAVRAWLQALDDGAVQEGFTQASLRQWRRQHKAHRSFTVLRHPVARAHAAFCDLIVPEDTPYQDLRRQLERHQAVVLPKEGEDTHAEGFKSFLRFLERNLSGQTAIRIDPHWTSQSVVIEGFGALSPPDILIREEELESALALLVASIGGSAMPAVPKITDPHADRLTQIYDGEIEKLCRAAYARDYHRFGFARWG